jgi:hypothetical protein
MVAVYATPALPDATLVRCDLNVLGSAWSPEIRNHRFLARGEIPQLRAGKVRLLRCGLFDAYDDMVGD